LTGAAKTWKTPHGMVGMDRHGKVAGGGGEFAKQALAWSAQWQTPSTDSFRCRGGTRKNEKGLDQQARAWPTPRAMSGGAESAARKQELGRKKSGGGDLQSAVSLWPTPVKGDWRSGVTGNIKKKNARPLCEVGSRFSLQAPTTSKPGKSSSDSTPLLNPRFVEHLMGMIPGWTAFAPLATGSFHSWLASHSSLLRELSSPGSTRLQEAA